MGAGRILDLIGSPCRLLERTASPSDARFFPSDDSSVMRKCLRPARHLPGESAMTGVARERLVLTAVDPDPADPTRDALPKRLRAIGGSRAARDVASEASPASVGAATASRISCRQNLTSRS